MRFEPEPGIEPELAHLDTASNENGFGAATSLSLPGNDSQRARGPDTPIPDSLPQKPGLVFFGNA
jgi:hypothetical protein